MKTIAQLRSKINNQVDEIRKALARFDTQRELHVNLALNHISKS